MAACSRARSIRAYVPRLVADRAIVPLTTAVPDIVIPRNPENVSQMLDRRRRRHRRPVSNAAPTLASGCARRLPSRGLAIDVVRCLVARREQ
jgi:hypothetical protein